MQNVKSRLIKALATAALIGPAFFGSAHAVVDHTAALVTYNLDGVTFADGTTASGSLTIDPVARISSSFSVSTTAGNLSAFTFDNSSSGLYFGGGAGPNNFILMVKNGTRYFNFSFLNPILADGGTFALNTANSYECMNCSPWRRVTAGSITSEATAVPEPSTIALLGLGLLGFAALRRRA
jgi:hypothetical protein